MTEYIIDPQTSLPRLGETMEAARARRVGAEPSIDITLPDSETAAEGSREISTKTVVAVAVVALLGGIGGEIYSKFSQPPIRTISERVQAYDSDWTVAQRAEDAYGKDPGEFSIAREADRLAGIYGTVLHPGQVLKVHVR